MQWSRTGIERGPDLLKTSTGEGANYLEAITCPKNQLFKKSMEKIV